ncbi:hypothetical protein DPM33_11985 [Mesorhizobium hawassense]|uniref:Cation-transporting P-type ATPase N-terminal domain-containing protein n=1 Tax=Mesorhizobium hawassense TaxID=1209954 RepID=A0A330HRI8_9HYPH|nr:cation-transporting P-type ATPase [Mesorhizobium hawassense]RAZ90995.1 hypothetical protein DPM33_11985 [Mesorhizobium hawassense]
MKGRTSGLVKLDFHGGQLPGINARELDCRTSARWRLGGIIDRRGRLEPVPAIDGAEGGLIPEHYFTDLASLPKPVLAAAPAGRWSRFMQRSELSSASIAQPAQIVILPALMPIKGPLGLLRYQTVMRKNSASPTWRGVGGPHWSRPTIEVLQECHSRLAGLTSTEARNGLSRHGPNTFADHRREQALAVLLWQFRNPLVLVLIVAAIVSGVVGEGREAVIIGAIILVSCGRGFSQEYSASRAVDALKQRITVAHALVSEWSKRLFFEHDRHHRGPRRRARHGRATVPGLIEDARSACHRQDMLPVSVGLEEEATEVRRR